MSKLRIVLLGKDSLANCSVRNFILGIDEKKTPRADVKYFTEIVGGQLKDRHITIINNSYLLQTNLSNDEIIKGVRDCVHLSNLGAHAIILVLQHNDFSQDDICRVKYVLKQFSEKAIKHTILLTTDTETLRSSSINSAIHQLTKECEGGHLQFDQREQGGCYSEIIERVQKINEKYKEFLRFELFDDAEEGTCMDDEQSTSSDSAKEEECSHEEPLGPKEGHKSGYRFINYVCKYNNFFTKYITKNKYTNKLSDNFSVTNI